jgi:Xaa-Pro aminopeptidase
LREPADQAIVEQLERRRRAAAERWSLGDEVVLIGAGTPIAIPGRADRTYPFRAHAEYFYLTDRERPGGVLAYDPDAGWVDFVVPVTQRELLWEAAEAAEAGAPDGTVPTSQLASWLEERNGRRVACLGAHVAGVVSETALEVDLRYELNHVRRQKDALELDRMREAERATSAGFAAILPLLERGRTERELQVELEAAFFRNGGDFLAYDSVVAGGPNSAVLHFAPTTRPLGEGELVLIDAGAEHRGYASDITRTYPVSGRFDAEQDQLHSIVRAAGDAATRSCTAGTEWKEVHRIAATRVAEGLVDFGLLRGQPDMLVERGTVALFFPHGVGHMVGLGVRDAGEILRGRRGREPGFPPLRVDLPLLPGHVVTVEPGIYFVPALLRDPESRARHRDAVDWDRADRMSTFGGIRIEDNVLVTEDGFEILTADVPVVR